MLIRKNFLSISSLLLLLLLCESFVQAYEIPIVKYREVLKEMSKGNNIIEKANPHWTKQDISKKDENISHFDGHKWKTLSFEQKCSLYHGYELGRIMTTERIAHLRNVLQNVIDKTVTEEIQEEFISLNKGLNIFNEVLDKYETIVEEAEMVSLVDKFYNNPANQSIRLHHAFAINKLIKNGESEEVIKELMDLYRRKDNQKIKNLITHTFILIPSAQPLLLLSAAP